MKRFIVLLFFFIPFDIFCQNGEKNMVYGEYINLNKSRCFVMFLSKIEKADSFGIFFQYSEVKKSTEDIYSNSCLELIPDYSGLFNLGQNNLSLFINGELFLSLRNIDTLKLLIIYDKLNKFKGDTLIRINSYYHQNFKDYRLWDYGKVRGGISFFLCDRFPDFIQPYFYFYDSTGNLSKQIKDTALIHPFSRILLQRDQQ